MSATVYDHLVIGAGHNGLACAHDLARRGRRVLVLEAAERVGGGAVTREFAPGFRVSACAHLLHALPQSLVADMALARHGLQFAATGMPTHALDGEGRSLRIAARRVDGPGLSAADTAAYAALRERLERFSRLLHPVLGMAPPRLTAEGWAQRLELLRLAVRVRLLGKRDMRELLRIAGMNVYDLMDDSFADPLLKGALAFDATLGAEYGPRSPGTVLTWLHRLAGEQGAAERGLAQPRGGMGALADAMAAAVRAAGGEIRTGARVARILVEDDQARGAVLADGDTIAARSVVSSLDPRSTFFKLLGTEHLDTGTVRRVDHFRARGLVGKLHLALDTLPAFRGLPVEALAGRLVYSPSMDYLELAFNPSKYRELPERPALEITVPTVNDPGLAPDGKHVMSVLVQFVPYDLGPEPDAARARLLEHVLATLERLAPGLRAQVRASELLAPADLEREFGLPGGHWHQGALDFDQFFVNRPFPGAQRYRGPLEGLYLCGASSHPGGGLMGFAGRNAARELLAAGGH